MSEDTTLEEARQLVATCPELLAALDPGSGLDDITSVTVSVGGLISGSETVSEG